MTNEFLEPDKKKTPSRLFSLIRHYLFDDEPDDTGESTAKYTRMLLAILIGWMVFWTVLPCVSLANDFVDVLENIVWGRHFQFGFDKNPYAGPFFGPFTAPTPGRVHDPEGAPSTRPPGSGGRASPVLS